jgi:glycosyltransferase involved in cell wall biosynthesis
MQLKTILFSISVMDRAGQETLIMNIFRTIDRTKYKFKFLCSLNKEGDYDKEIKRLGGEIYCVPESKMERIPLLKYVFRIFFRKKAFEQIDFDILHTCDYHAFEVLFSLLAAKLARVNHMIVHSHNSSAPLPWLHKMVRPIILLFRFNKMACSTEAATWMFGRTKDVAILTNAIIVSEFAFSPQQRIALRKELGVEDKIVLTHIGRFNFQKNHFFLLNIFKEFIKQHPDAVLLLIGRGELENDVKEYARKSGIFDQILFLGIREDIPTVLSASDMFIFPSLFEGLSVILIEVQANGLFCVASDTIHPKTIIANNFITCSLNSVPSVWSDTIHNHLEATYDRTKSVNSILNTEFDIQFMVDKLVSIYDGLA